jgi:tryptophan-rich sensory protein
MSANRSYFMLLVFVTLVSVVAMSGVLFQPAEWYEHLDKPLWTPPNWLFLPVWSALYLMIAIAGWLIFLNDNRSLKVLWVCQLF